MSACSLEHGDYAKTPGILPTVGTHVDLLKKKKNDMFQGTKATPFICNTVFQNRSLMREISLFCEDNLISIHTVVRTDVFGHDTLVKRGIYFESRKDLFF